MFVFNLWGRETLMRKNKKKTKEDRGFSLVELIIVVALKIYKRCRRYVAIRRNCGHLFFTQINGIKFLI